MLLCVYRKSTGRTGGQFQQFIPLYIIIILNRLHRPTEGGIRSFAPPPFWDIVINFTKRQYISQYSSSLSLAPSPIEFLCTPLDLFAVWTFCYLTVMFCLLLGSTISTRLMTSFSLISDRRRRRRPSPLSQAQSGPRRRPLEGRPRRPQCPRRPPPPRLRPVLKHQNRQRCKWEAPAPVSGWGSSFEFINS